MNLDKKKVTKNIKKQLSKQQKNNFLATMMAGIFKQLLGLLFLALFAVGVYGAGPLDAVGGGGGGDNGLLGAVPAVGPVAAPVVRPVPLAGPILGGSGGSGGAARWSGHETEDCKITQT